MALINPVITPGRLRRVRVRVRAEAGVGWDICLVHPELKSPSVFS